MRTFLYNTITKQRIGEIREGRYLVDGKPAPLPPELLELEMVSLPEPSYNTNTHTREEKEYVDLNKKQWIKEYYLKQKPSSEISETTSSQVPSTCHIKKFRLALINSGISPYTIFSKLNELSDIKERETLLTEWEYSDFVKRNSLLVSKIIQISSLSESTMDEIFIQGNIPENGIV